MKDWAAGNPFAELCMQPEEEWSQIRGDRLPSASLGISAIRVALLFGSAAIALALILVPLADNQVRNFAAADGLDMTSTGSIARDETYTIRRSVLQPSEDSVCIIRANGTRTGEC
jgi:hypothetical protein